jgi:hypothetical protein
MLGSERFAFERPNVMDPGDLPPSARPQESRGQKEYQQQGESGSLLLADFSDLQLAPDANVPYGDDQPQQQDWESPSFRMTDSNKRNLQNNYAHTALPSLNMTNNTSRKAYFDDLSQSSGSSSSYNSRSGNHSLPSVEEARTYAASLLHSAEQTRSGGDSNRDPFRLLVAFSRTNSVRWGQQSRSFCTNGPMGGTVLLMLAVAVSWWQAIRPNIWSDGNLSP